MNLFKKIGFWFCGVKLNGKVVLGKGVKLGKNVLLSGNIVIGNNTKIEHGCQIIGNVEVGQNCQIAMNNSILGKSVLGDNCILFPANYLENATVFDGVTIKQSFVTSAIIEDGANIGPFANIRPNSFIGKNCRIGNFVEIKNSTLEQNTKAAHHAYIGDAIVGEHCNIGCGVIFANFDGQKKHTTRVGNNCFIGSNSNLIAPITIGNNCFIAAGSNVVSDINDNGFAIGRVDASVKENGAQKYLNKK